MSIQYKQLEREWCKRWFQFILDHLEKPWAWDYISQDMTWEIIQANPDKPWDWNWVSVNPNITWEIIQANPDKDLNWEDISKNPNIPGK